MFLKLLLCPFLCGWCPEPCSSPTGSSRCPADPPSHPGGGHRLLPLPHWTVGQRVPPAPPRLDPSQGLLEPVRYTPSSGPPPPVAPTRLGSRSVLLPGPCDPSDCLSRKHSCVLLWGEPNKKRLHFNECQLPSRHGLHPSQHMHQIDSPQPGLESWNGLTPVPRLPPHRLRALQPALCLTSQCPKKCKPRCRDGKQAQRDWPRRSALCQHQSWANARYSLPCLVPLTWPRSWHDRELNPGQQPNGCTGSLVPRLIGPFAFILLQADSLLKA